MASPIPRRNFLKTAAACGFSPLAPRSLAAGQSQDWRHYGGDAESSRYSPLSQITAANVSDLKPAWVHRSAPENSRYRGSVECSPVVADGVMYIVGSGLVIQALQASSGKLLWSFSPIGGNPGGRGVGTNRGVTYWKGGGSERVYIPIQNKMWCLDAKTGKPIPSFGDEGAIDLEKDVDRDVPGLSIVSTTPGAIYQDLLIVTSRTGEGPRAAAPGHIRAYDLRSGKRKWIFHTIPHPGEFGYDTWSPEAWKTTGGANCWGGMSIDEKRGLAFLGTGSPTFDFYGGDRVGAGLFGNCVLALKAETGERVWHFQTVHHDLWDYDIPCSPMLVTVTHNGRKVDIVAQVSKTGWVYLLDRQTGKPLYPIEERPVPQTDLPGEKTYPTQPFPTAPPPFSKHGISREDLTDISPEAHAYALEKTKDYRFGPMFTPPGKRETMTFPGFHGGALWGGASFDPQSEWLYVNHNEISWTTAIEEAERERGLSLRLQRIPYERRRAGLSDHPAALGTDFGDRPEERQDCLADAAWRVQGTDRARYPAHRHLHPGWQRRHQGRSCLRRGYAR